MFQSFCHLGTQLALAKTSPILPRPPRHRARMAAVGATELARAELYGVSLVFLASKRKPSPREGKTIAALFTVSDKCE